MNSQIRVPGSLRRWSFWGGLRGFTPVATNPRRKLAPEHEGYAGANFDDIAPFETDTFTFDFYDRLTTGGRRLAEGIDQIQAFALVPIIGVDIDPAARVAGSATIDGTLVSQRFGNWLGGAIRYRIYARVSTTNGNTISNWSYFWVRPPGFRC